MAVELPEAGRRLLAGHLRDCAQAAPGYRWVDPDSLHLTLRFLGRLEPEALARVRERLREVSASPFTLGLDGRGTFGSRRAPRVVWLGLVDGLDRCAALATAVDAACGAAGMEPDERPFRAHVTLGRQRTEGERLPALPDPPALAPWSVREFVLFESRLNQQPRYVPLARFPLPPSASG